MIVGVTKQPFGTRERCTEGHCTHNPVTHTHTDTHTHTHACTHTHTTQTAAASPADADMKGLCGMYQRIVMVPRPDYASRCGEVTPSQL